MESDLTKEQIVGEGWTYIRTNNKDQIYEKGLYGLRYNTVTKVATFNRIDINSQREYKPSNTITSNCPDLKTFKFVCNTLNI